jgi:hypothetical protein
MEYAIHWFSLDRKSIGLSLDDVFRLSILLDVRKKIPVEVRCWVYFRPYLARFYRRILAS